MKNESTSELAQLLNNPPSLNSELNQLNNNYKTCQEKGDGK